MKDKQNSNESNHISTRIDPELKRRAIEHAGLIERHKSWVFAKAIELGLPQVFEQFPPPRRKRAA